MIKLVRILLYWLARVAGVIGLVAGGKSLGKYALARLNDPYFDSFSYNDLVFSGGVIFLLSLLVLIFADVGHSLNSRTGGAGHSGSPSQPFLPPAKPAEAGPLPRPAPATDPDVERASADEKLARLLKRKKE